MPADHGTPARTISLALDELLGDSPTWLVFDGEPFLAHPDATVCPRGCRLLVVDDRPEPSPYHADAILNPSLQAMAWDYPTDGRTLQLLGPRYAPLGPEFAAWHTWRRITPPVARKILLPAGSLDVLRASQHVRIPGLATRVVGRNILPEQLAWADVAVSVGASACWESAFMQLPTLILVTTDRELPLVRFLEHARIVESLGWAHHATPASIARSLADFCCDPRIRQRQSTEGRRLVDGQGAARVAALIRAVDTPLPDDQLMLRRANLDDLLPLWRMSNEPSVLQTALYDKPCPLDRFAAWFEENLADEESRTWVLDFHGQIVAHVRYDRRSTGWAEIAIAVLPVFRGRGLALRLLEGTCRQAREELGVSRLRAVIREENTISQHLFRKAGFTFVARRILCEKPCQLHEL
jgi:RimJ/RimL family protein N-acetyltransferase